MKSIPEQQSRATKENLFVYVDGELLPRSKATVSVFDHGLLYGDGVFEGIRAYNGVVFKLKEHIDRLYESANYIRLAIPMQKEQMIQSVLETLRKNNLKDAYIRLLVTRGVGDLGLNPTICKSPSIVVITEPSAPSRDPRTNAIGKTTIISSIRRDPVDATSHEVKSLNYMNSILARWEAIEAGVDEAIMLDTRGFVSEATAENVFIVRKGQLATPSTNSAILHGVTRQRVIEIASDLGYSVSEREITPFELINADEVFLTGTLAELVPVIRVNGRIIGSGKVGPVTARIYGEFVKVRSDAEEGIPIFPGIESPEIKARGA
ncbi:MAG TPA: branched-chain-amino-acid transaminase [Nitrososphaerales archaeon]|nr:branched-chain-amino-acid transaminase [Nitrososphaerales archaeon]